MTAKYYNLDREQALHWPLDTFLVMMKQPPKGYEYRGIACNEACFIDTTTSLMAFTEEIKLPYAVGDKVGFRHKGKVIGEGKVVSVDCKRVQELTRDELLEMPYLVELYTAREVTSMEATLRDLLADYFNNRYAKPKAIRKHGKIVGYVCHLYSPKNGEWFIEKYAKYLQSTCDSALSGFTYKGLPLEIINNSFILLVKMEESEKGDLY